MSHISFLDAAAIAGTLVLLGLGAWADTPAFSRQDLAPVREFSITARRFVFEPATIEVAEGDRVRLVVRSDDGTHGFAIKKLKIETEVPRGGEPVTVEFVAARAGRFEVSCSEYCGKGHKGMKAWLVVQPSESSVRKGAEQ